MTEQTIIEEIFLLSRKKATEVAFYYFLFRGIATQGLKRPMRNVYRLRLL